MNYDQLFSDSIQNKDAFWKKQAGEISWFKFPQQITSADENNYNQWFADGELNMSYLCIDKHIEDGFGEQIAVVYDSPVTDQKQTYTFHQLKNEVSKLADALQSLGLEKGDTAVIYMPMIPQTLFAMLACARIGGTQISDTDLEKQIVQNVREKIGAVACLKNVMVVKRLPKTRSGKILRKLIRTMLDDKDFQIPSTIDDENIIDELREKIKFYKNIAK